jgi:hypothetical protein
VGGGDCFCELCCMMMHTIRSVSLPQQPARIARSGQEDYDRLRPLSYPGTNVFLVSFSIISPTSYENVKTKVGVEVIVGDSAGLKSGVCCPNLIQWYPEICHYAAGVPFILVGTKEDLRFNEEYVAKLRAEGKSPLTPKDGQRLADVSAPRDLGRGAQGDSDAFIFPPPSRRLALSSTWSALHSRRRASSSCLTRPSG